MEIPKAELPENSLKNFSEKSENSGHREELTV
jgi:hypothetical protein